MSNYLRNHFFTKCDLTSWLVTRGQKEGIYIWVPEIMINDLVHKGLTKLNIFSVFSEQIKSVFSKQSKLKFWNWPHPKIAFVCRFLTQTANWWPNYTFLTSSVNAIQKSMTDTVFFGTKLRGGQIVFFYLQPEVFSTI